MRDLDEDGQGDGRDAGCGVRALKRVCVHTLSGGLPYVHPECLRTLQELFACVIVVLCRVKLSQGFGLLFGLSSNLVHD